MNLAFDHFQLRSMPNITLEMGEERGGGWCKQQKQLFAERLFKPCEIHCNIVFLLMIFARKGDVNEKNSSSGGVNVKNPHFSMLHTLASI